MVIFCIASVPIINEKLCIFQAFFDFKKLFKSGVGVTVCVFKNEILL